MARGAFAAVMLGLTIAFFLIGQSVQSGGRLILSQSFYMLAAFFAAMLVVTILPGRSTPPDK
ncbi:MAG TPA: hypothetical protein VHZ96_07620 [Frankiaceae bacterium]|nr:hypothetical protein [Frankiaceae bacterium]